MLWIWLEIPDYFQTARRRLEWLGHIRWGMIARGMESLAVMGILVWLAARGLRSRDETASASATRVLPPTSAPIIIEQAVVVQPEPPVDSTPVLKQPIVVPRPLTRVEQLEQDLDAAKQRCIDRLIATEDYQQAKTRAQELEERASVLRKQENHRELPQVSLEWVQAKSRVATMVSTALADDPDVRSIQDQLENVGVLRRGRKIYVFESGAKRSSTTQPAESKSKTSRNR